MTVREAADQLRVGTWAIYHHCETGELRIGTLYLAIRALRSNLVH